MSVPLTRATTGSDAAPDDDDDDEDCCCPQPVTIGSTTSASAATVETAVRRGRSARGARHVDRGSFSDIMAPSLERMLVPPVSEVRETPAAHSDTSFGNKGHQQLYESSAAFDLKFLAEVAATAVGTSNRRHEPADRGMGADTRAIATPLQWPERGRNLKRK